MSRKAFVPVKPSHKGRLHKALGIPEGEKIPVRLIQRAMHSTNPHMRAMAQEAHTMRGWNHRRANGEGASTRSSAR